LNLVLCRNVLIYFDVDTKKNILGGIRSSLAEQACLLLGCAESTFNLDSGFVKEVGRPTALYQVAE